MGSENLAYALIQVVHNLGAVAVVGGALSALWPRSRLEYARSYGWLLLAGWGTQIASGLAFGLTSLYYYGETPDLSPVALTALVVKIATAAGGFLLAAFYLARGGAWSPAGARRSFLALAALGIVALTAAAFLRWFA